MALFDSRRNPCGRCRRSILGPPCEQISLPFYAGWLVSASIVLCVAMTMATARARLQNRNVALSIATACAAVGPLAASIGLAYAGWHNELPLLIGMAAIFLSRQCSFWVCRLEGCC